MLYECSRCLKYFDKKSNYNQHLGRKIQCKEIINKKFDEDVMVNNEEDRTDNKLSKMDNHGYILDNKLSVLDNNNQIQFNNPLKCKLCGNTYKYLSGLCKHKKEKHPNYDIDIQNINHNKNDKSEIDKSELDKFKELFMTQIKKLEEKNKELDNKNKQLELLVKTSKSKNNTKNNTKNITNNSNNSTNTNNGTINNINIVQFGKLNNNLSYDDPNNVIYMTLLGSSYDKLLLRSPSIKSS